jgi:phosphoribosyl-AMP cyclohydrolase / phosphoribosyl-ATP pyrophosphohydrolase
MPTMPNAAELWATLAPDAASLVPAIVQHAHTGQVLMLGYMNEAALAATLSGGRVTFFSRSRGTLWEKGETSGHVLELVSMRVDCDGDALLVRAVPHGPTCHTGTTSCFFRRVEGDDASACPTDDGPRAPAGAILDRVFAVILERKAGRGATRADGASYVQRLLSGGASGINAKIDEEAQELQRAIASEPDARVAAEAADLLFHALVGLAHRDVDPAAVMQVLASRLGTSGIDEKERRGGG